MLQEIIKWLQMPGLQHFLIISGVLIRNAASPAYMAMEHAASAMLAARGEKYSSHGAVHARFGELFSKTRLVDPKFHRYLLNGFELRHNAEYERGLVVSAEDMESTLKNATEFVAMAEQFLKEEEQ